MQFTVVIPARYASTRFPGKPLAQIRGKAMLAHVHDRAIESGASRIIVATDDDRIASLVQQFGGELCMTGAHHVSGTTRISEVIQNCNISENEIVVNVQGDEPFIPAENIRQVASNLSKFDDYPMATLCYPIAETDDLLNPNVVKVVQSEAGSALYFSRSPIPFPAKYMSDGKLTVALSQIPMTFYRHIGIYAYRAGFVKKYASMSAAPLETTESLEQLRVLANGFPIHIEASKAAPPHGVDTPEDLARLS
ncbi:3-deoxy-manno-octulosonate cytidylyltransferase [Agaribacter marinus]|uniref:3-deoxy-manno-octulosonate cytidylyltransferase n=1 Tax=Agaribacter marinus TaxID=1431249 RepID=A0AA37WJQ4_9ALTE|nr:3-deoxy-manno-octulosonate cytidylyltransferase [Agaribacter marinus]GLR70459.1 3-deoxy-manno-octulosonate cytidylyltransferase [Agaribacter marinus]